MSKEFPLFDPANPPFPPRVPGIIAKKPALPADAKERKAIPLCTGVLDYFPDALCDVAALSQVGNDQHNPGQPLHWSKHKSTDHGNCILRHQIDRGTRDTDGVRHSAKVAWRALAQLQIEIEAERAGLSIDNYLTKLKNDAERLVAKAPELGMGYDRQTQYKDGL
jgi:hypothetical protein